ncbi:MAG: pepsin/retropepsin-like aspartic protease family protein [Bacteroidota bacterium]
MRVFLTVLIYSLLGTTFASSSCIGSFELINNMIVVEAEIEGEDGYFIIDTGSPHLMLNARHFEGERSAWQATGVSGRVDLDNKLLAKFQWGCVTEKHFNAYVADLNYLEQAIDRPLFGLIGYEILKQKELLIDYEKAQIEQHHIKKSDLHRYAAPNSSINFRLRSHQPILEIELEDERSVQVILDTASEDNILQNDADNNQYTIKDMKFLVGANQQQSLAKVVTIPSLSLTNMELENQECLLTNLQHTSVQGIIGAPILQELKRFSINYRKKQIYIWE